MWNPAKRNNSFMSFRAEFLKRTSFIKLHMPVCRMDSHNPLGQLCTDLFRHVKCTSLTSSVIESPGLIGFFLHLQ